MLCALLLVLPMATRTGLGLLIAACGLLWLVWGLATPPVQRPLGAINGWLLVYLAIAVVATGLSPVPAAAAKGLLKLLSYLGVYALMRRLLEGAPQWWNRLLAALLLGQLITAVIGLRQLYAPIEDLALWADPNSVADGTRRIYSTLGNPNLLAGYLVPILPLAVIGLLRWQGLWPKLLALSSLGCGLAAALLSYSRGGWIGLLLALGSLGLLLLLRQSRRLGPTVGKTAATAGDHRRGGGAGAGGHQGGAAAHSPHQHAGRSRRQLQQLPHQRLAGGDGDDPGAALDWHWPGQQCLQPDLSALSTTRLHRLERLLRSARARR